MKRFFEFKLLMWTIAIIMGISINQIYGQQHQPDGPHPRIWLTPEMISTIKTRMTNNTTEWQNLKSYLDDYLNEIPWGWQFMDGIPSYALGFLVTNNTTYADRALEFMDLWVDRLNSTNPFFVNADHYAHWDEAIGLGFDWLYNYPGMTQSRKQSYIDMMNKVFIYGMKPWPEGGEFEGDPRDSDRFIGNAKTHLIWGLATYGDNLMADSLIQRAEYLWDNFIRKWIQDCIGGVWPEGSQYSFNTLWFLFALTEAERTATGRDVWKEDAIISSFVPNSIKALLWLTPPSNDHVLRYNDQEDPDSFYWQRRNHFLAVATYAAEKQGFTTEAAFGRYWIRELCPENIDINYWKLFLFYDPNAPHTNYFTQNLPRAYFADGLDWLFFRSNWTELSTYGTFNASWTDVDHQFADGGHFNIWRMGSYLTQGVRHYDFRLVVNGKEQPYDGEASNIMLIESDYEEESLINAMGSPELFESKGRANITKHRLNDNPLFAYSFANLGDSYNRVYHEWGGNSSRVISYTRQFVYTAPDYFFVYDRVRTKDQGWLKYVLHSSTEPTINGKLITQKDYAGTGKLFHLTLFPPSVNLTKIDEKIVWSSTNGMEDWMVPPSERNWHVNIQPPDASSIDMLNIMEAAEGTKSTMDDHELINNDGTLGTRLSDWVITFAKQESTRTTVTYSISYPGVTLRHLVCDLEADITYRIELNGALLKKENTESHGTIFFETNDASPTSTVVIAKSTSKVQQSLDETPYDYALNPNYPNPFNAATKITYQLPQAESVVLKIYSLLGEEIVTLINERKNTGFYTVSWDGLDESGKLVPSGIYVYKLNTGSFSAVKKAVLIK